MAMNKKEQELLAEAITSAKINRALRWSDCKWLPDVPRPERYSDLALGWNFNVHLLDSRPSEAVYKACSRSVSNGHGWEKTDTQGAISLYSTRLMALRALRQAAELKYAKVLAGIDRMIEEEVLNVQEESV